MFRASVVRIAIVEHLQSSACGVVELQRNGAIASEPIVVVTKYENMDKRERERERGREQRQR
jgi:hypothetical protein